MGRSANVSAEVFADFQANVGEAPHWDDQTNTLLFAGRPAR